MKTKKIKTAKRPTKLKHKAKQAIKRARPIHHRVLLHPFTVFVLLCTGVFIANWTFRVAADSIQVSAKVAAAPLTEGATITQPADGAIITNNPINVFGTCPLNSYVVLFKNSTMSGMALCTASNTYEIQTSLFPDTNVLKVQAYNLTDDPGPITPEITVTYRPPLVPLNTSAKPGPQAKPQEITQSLPIITSRFSYSSFTVNSGFEWPVEATGGTEPYKITSYWGDDQSSNQPIPSATSTWIMHKYTKAGLYKIKVRLTDTHNNESWLQLFAVIRLPNSLAGNGSLIDGTGTASILPSLQVLLSQHWLQLAWGSYATVAIMTLSFWLGERQQLLNIVAHKRTRHKPA